MSYTTPSTAVTGGTLTTNIWNTEVRDNLNFLRSYGTALAGTAGTAWNVTTLAGTAGTAVNLTATQGSVVALSGSVTNIFTQPIGTVTTSGTTYTIVNSDKNKLLISNATNAGTVIIPADTLTSGGSFSNGQSLTIAQMGTGQITINGMASAVANGTTTVRSTPSSTIRAQYSVVTLVKIASNEWLLVGDLQ